MWIEQLIFNSTNHAAQAFYIDVLSRGYILLSDMREFTKKPPPPFRKLGGTATASPRILPTRWKRCIFCSSGDSKGVRGLNYARFGH